MTAIPRAIKRTRKTADEIHAATIERSLAVLAAVNAKEPYSSIAGRMKVSTERVRQLANKGRAFAARPARAKAPAKATAKAQPKTRPAKQARPTPRTVTEPAKAAKATKASKTAKRRR